MISQEKVGNEDAKTDYTTRVTRMRSTKWEMGENVGSNENYPKGVVQK